MNKPTTGKTILALILAVGIGVGASGWLTALSFSGAFLSMLVFVAPLLTMFLFGFGGVLPAAVMLTTLEIGTYFMMGTVGALALIPAAVIPAAEMMYLSQKGLPFFKQVRYALVTQALGLIVLVAAAYGYFQADLGTVAADYMRANLMGMPEEIQSVVASTLRQVFSQIGMTMPETDAELLSTIFDEYEQALKQTLPTFMVMLVGLNAGIGVLWGNFLRVRHGEENAQFEGAGKWHLPASTVLGLTFSFIFTIIMARINPEQWTMVLSVMGSIVSLACITQASDSMLYRMRVAGFSRGKRTAFFILFVLFLGAYIMIPYGALSAYFGAKGVFTKRLKARAEKMRQDKEDQ